ncbi:MAG: DegV family protein [Clostridiales bacterium]|nr:DegV family protein [Clostridiales bacterium]
MRPVRVFTDSTADIPIELREQYNISLIPLYVTIGEQIYRDQVDIDTSKLYDLVNEVGELPKTAAPSTQDFINSFKPWIDNGNDIIFLGISSKLSATVQSAGLAAQELGEDRVRVVDSGNLSMGIGLMAIKAAQWASEGLSSEAIYNNLIDMRMRTRTSFVIDTLKFLHMGGRCSALELIAGTVLKIRPQIVVREGSLHVADKHRGKKMKTLDVFYDNFVEANQNIETDIIAVAHSADPSSAEYLENKLLESGLKFNNIYVVEAGTVISSHCGPGTVGVLFIEKENR